MASVHYLQQDRPRTASPREALTHSSSMREKVFEHLLLAELGLELMHRGVEFEVLHGETDRDGYDVIIEAGSILRHIQLKVTILGGARADVSVNTRLAAKPAGCVVWLTFDPATRSFTAIRWFGNPPGQPLPELGGKVARHSRGNAQGVKAYRDGHRIVAANRFKPIDDIAHLADKLFGRLPADSLAFLRSRLRLDDAPTPAWVAEVAAGEFSAIPDGIGWDDAAPLAHLVDGYRLLDILGGGDPAAFLEHQREAQRATGHWPGDAAMLWTTLFLEARADRFGGHDSGAAAPHLDLLCHQLRSALIGLETIHV